MWRILDFLLYKVVTRSSFSVIRQHKASGGTWTLFGHCDTRSNMNLERQLKDRDVSSNTCNRKTLVGGRLDQCSINRRCHGTITFGH